MVNTKSVVLDGERYDLTHLNPTKAWSTLTRLLRIVGGPMGAGIEAKSIKSIKEMDINIKFDDLLRTLCNNLDTPDAEEVVYSLLSVTAHKGHMLKDQYLEDHFRGKVGSMFGVVIEQVKFQYEDFFAKISSLIGAAVQNQNSGSLQPPMSLGKSTESSSQKSQPSRK